MRPSTERNHIQSPCRFKGIRQVFKQDPATAVIKSDGVILVPRNIQFRDVLVHLIGSTDLRITLNDSQTYKAE